MESYDFLFEKKGKNNNLWPVDTLLITVQPAGALRCNPSVTYLDYHEQRSDPWVAGVFQLSE